MSENAVGAFVAVVVGILVVGLIAGSCALYPKYKVYQLTHQGKAQLREAEFNRQIEIEEAAAHLAASVNLAAAEVERAKGVAEANRIIGESLKENESYLRWLWIEGLKTNNQQIVYIPTEAGLPILEARNR